MKRLFVLFAFLLLSCAFNAQDVKAQSEGTLMVVPRLDVDPARSFGEGWSLDPGATSLYTFFDGNLGEHFSFSFANHWLSFNDWSFDGTKELYGNTWRADALNWVDWANVTARFGNLFLTLGKDYIHFGTFEQDAYDYASHWQINSSLWNNYQVYQWGGSFGWSNEDEDTQLMLQVSCDQLMEKPFDSRRASDYAYTLYGVHWGGEVSVMGSVSHCSLGWMGALGLGLVLTDDISLHGDGYLADSYYGASARIAAEPGSQFELFVKGGFDIGSNEIILDGNRIYCGAGCYWYPLPLRHDLRVHALCSYDSLQQALCFSAGVLYELNLYLF